VSIYGEHEAALRRVMAKTAEYIEDCGKRYAREHGEKLFEHLSFRLKSEESVREKLRRKGLEETAGNAVSGIRDAVGLRAVCLFIDDVYETARLIREMPGCTVVAEKDYIRSAKPNGYRSYHMILRLTDPGEKGIPGEAYFAEVQLRTIAMDTWAALEHEMKYKKSIAEQELIIGELRRCANELASCDVSMQTLRKIIRETPLETA